MTDKIIMFDSPEAAEPYTMHGWKSSNGFFYPNEHSARYEGCTHRPCRECGAPAKKMYTACDECREKAEIAKYDAMPAAEWDGEAILYSDSRDEYYRNLDAAEDALDEGQSLADLRLVLCEPNYCCQIEEDFFCDKLAEDGEVPGHIWDAMEAFNESVAGTVLSWSPGKCRMKMGEGQ